MLVPLWFLPLVPCKCRASVSLRVLARNAKMGGRTTGPEGPPFLRQPRAGLWGGVHVLVAGSLRGKGIEPLSASSLRLEQIGSVKGILARWGPNHPLAMDPPGGDDPAREHDWATLARELRFWLNRREDQLEEGLVNLGQQLLGRLVARARAARLRTLEMEPVPVKAPPAIAKKAATPKAPPPLLPQNTAARSPSPGARVWYGGSANKLAPNAICSKQRGLR